MKLFLSTLCLVSLSFYSAAQSEVYKFQHEVKAKMTYNSSGSENGALDYKFLLPKQGNYVGMIGDMSQAGQKMSVEAVFDVDKNILLVLMDQAGMKLGMRSKVDQTMDVMDEKTNSARIVKTGNTKNILNRKCEEYEIQDEESYTLVYMSKEVGLRNFYDALNAMNPQENDMKIPEGFLMEMVSWPEGKDSDEKITLLVQEINLNKSSEISTTGYQFMDVPNR